MMVRAACVLCGIAALLTGCATTATDQVRDNAADTFRCAPASVEVTRTAPDEYEATGCGMRAVYECLEKRHHRAEGARYEACRRVSEGAWPMRPAPSDPL